MKITVGRMVQYLAGLFILALGVAFAIAANLGVSPVSSVPYSITLVTGIDMGIVTIGWQCSLVLLQFFIYGRKDFKMSYLLQVPVSFAFGLLTSTANYIVLDVLALSIESIVIKVIMLLISIVIIALGLSLYVRANIMYQSNEGFVAAIATKTGKEFPKIKIICDLCMAAFSTGICLIFTGGFGSIGLGTLVSAFLIAPVMGVIMKMLDKFKKTEPQTAKNN